MLQNAAIDDWRTLPEIMGGRIRAGAAAVRLPAEYGLLRED